MIPPESQPELDQAISYFDPEAPDVSEQEFSASLNEPAERPQFVMDEPEASRDGGDCEGQNSWKPTSTMMNQDSGGKADSPQQSPSTHPQNSDWREQVSAKVSNYKSRSRHKPRYPSLQLQFDQVPYRSQAEGRSPLSFSQTVAAEIVALQPSPVQEPEPRINLEATARVLEFPRPEPPRIDPNQLAEPILDRPRIVEAPELVPPPPAMGGILIEVAREPEPERRPGFDVPLQSSPLGRRVWAGFVDFLLVAIALAAFGYIFVRINTTIPAGPRVAQFVVVLLAVLWPAYEYAFLVFSGSTPGLRLAKLEIQQFSGAPASRSLRRWRVLASFLSAASLGLGYAWCFLDEDQLSWHDRITRTHLAPVSRR
jgi:uncharacterized RDD family membrane protein YckC